MPALLKDVCERKPWRPNISRTTGTSLWIGGGGGWGGGHGSINEMVVSQTKQIHACTPRFIQMLKLLRGEEKNSHRGRKMSGLC